MRLENESGEKVYTLKDGQEVFVCKNQENGTLILTDYSNDGRLLNVCFSTDNRCGIMPKENTECIKAYLFNNTNDLKPLCAVDELKRCDVSKEGLLSSESAVLSDAKYNMHPCYEWITEGNNKTDTGLQGGFDELFDGKTTTLKSTTERDSCGNLLIHFDDVAEITKATVRSLCSNQSYMQSFDVYASLDNVNYNFIASCENKNSVKVNSVMATNCDIKNKVYAKDIKLVMHKKPDAKNMSIAEVEVYGKPIAREKIRAFEYAYSKEAPFETSEDIIISDGENDVLSDGELSKSVSSTGEYVTLVYELKDYCQIEDINVWGNASGCEVLISPDGANYISIGYYGLDGKMNAHGISGKNGGDLKLIFHKGDLSEISLSEIEVYTREIFDKTQEVRENPEPIPVYTYLKPNNILYLDFTDYDGRLNGTKDYAVYLSKNNFSGIDKIVPAEIYVKGEGKRLLYTDEKYCCVCGLEPDCDYYVAVVPRFSDRLITEAKPVKIHTYPMLATPTAASTFCINCYPLTSSDVENEKHENPKEEERKSLALLSCFENVAETRFWNHISDDYRAKGISYFPSSARNEDYCKMLNRDGVHMTGVYNEPDINPNIKDNIPMYLNAVKEQYNLVKGVNEKNIIAAPTLCGTDTLLWYENLYKQDILFGGYYDAVDVHLYCKQGEGMRHEDDEYTDFESYAVPEHIFGKVKRIKSILAKYEGNADKPIITSEIGWSTHTKEGTVFEIDTPERQADYVVRAYLVGIASGVKRTYIYSFRDTDYKTDNPNWQFGMVDWYGNPKPAYYATYTLMKLLKNAEYMGSVDGISHPDYGCEFYDESKNCYITALWTADGKEREVKLSAEVMLVADSYGCVDNSGSSTVKIGKSPVYIMTKNKPAVSKKD